MAASCIDITLRLLGSPMRGTAQPQFSSGDFVTILHQDDLLDAQYLSSIEAALMRFPHAGHGYSACRYIDCARERNAAYRCRIQPSRNCWMGKITPIDISTACFQISTFIAVRVSPRRGNC